jgi:hypothetical protein
LLNTGCVAILGGTYQTIDAVTTAGTAVSYGATGKGLTDHAISKIAGKDCRMTNILKNIDVCYEGTSLENKNYLIGIYEENYEWPVQSVTNNIISPVVGDPVNKLTKGKQNERKLGTRHSRHAHKIRGKRSNPKVECKPSSGIFRIPDPFLARRTGRNETCSKNR